MLQAIKALDLVDSTGATSIIGKDLILHGATCDCTSQPTGTSGKGMKERGENEGKTRVGRREGRSGRGSEEGERARTFEVQ